MNGMFDGFGNGLITFSLGALFSTRGVTDAKYMFRDALGNTESFALGKDFVLPLDADCRYMFYDFGEKCKEVDVSGINFKQVKINDETFFRSNNRPTIRFYVKDNESLETLSVYESKYERESEV